MPEIRVFLSFDREHDRDLYARILEESQLPGAGFEIVGHSEARVSDSALRKRLAAVDHLIVLCGEHTDECEPVAAELQAAVEAEIPCLMLWGRRESMCTRPIGARRESSMYIWSREVVREQLAAALRSNATREALARVPRPHRA